MRVCHIASGDAWAGAEVQIAHLLRALVQRPGIELSAVLLNEGRLAVELRAAGVPVVVLPETRLSFPRLLWNAGKYVRGRGASILHSHRYKENLIAACLVKAGVSEFHVRTQHGRPEPFRSYRAVKQRVLHGADRWVAEHATDRVISVSHELSAYFPASIAHKVAVIHNGVDLRSIRSNMEPAAAKRRLGLNEDSPVIGSLGRMEPVKRLDLFVETARRIRAAYPDTQFVIAGSGSSEAEIRKMVKGDSSFHILGYRDDTYDVLRAMDLLLLTSDHEGLPMVLLEAQALGIPVLSRNVGGVGEVIESGANGLLVNSADPACLGSECVALLRDEVRRNAMARFAQTRAADFDVRGTAAQVSELYASLVSGRAA
jgi:glycosyltransferase involved in cell wall biosynthesis